MKYTFENIKEEGLLLYEYVRGSTAYGLSLPTSDVDTGGVFIMNKRDLFGLPQNMVEQVNDERNDNVWYEISKYVSLLAKANPTMLESLFVPDSCIRYMHPAFKILRDNRDVFVTKDCFDSFTGYAKQQIAKARGLNKKIVNPMTRRKHIIEFCHTFKFQGSTTFEKFLEERGLKPRYCGLVHISDMEQMYGVYYDFGNHFLNEGIKEYHDCSEQLFDFICQNLGIKAISFNTEMVDEFIKTCKPIGYRGVYDENNETTQLRLSSVAEGAKPICHIQFNENGFKQHCVKWKEYQEWVKKRNPQRYKENQDKEFDRKNMMHCTRILNMGIEIAKTGQINVDRTNIDREFLLNIRLGNTTYDDIITHVTAKQDELDEAIKNSTLPEHCDMEKVNELLIKLHEAIYNNDYVYLEEEEKPDCNKCGDYEYCAFHYDECTGFIPGNSSYLNDDDDE